MSRRLNRGDTLVLASHNAGKLRELRALLEPFGIHAKSVAEYGAAEPDETGTTFAENARIKAHDAARLSGHPALSDDSGIAIDALGGAPGVYTADWAETSNGRDFVLAMTRAYDALREAAAPKPWSAAFHCTLCVAWPDGADQLFEGMVSGTLTWPMRGSHGFGYDPMFIPEGYEHTFGEMRPEEKAPLTHRAVAFTLLKTELLPAE
ncbi:MAG: RdgB/HAM1 family non-canonical purine NTP pyrophosphatase [Shimia sp.]